MKQKNQWAFLKKFKTLAFLTVVFFLLGLVIVPHLNTVKYREGDDVSAFPVLAYSMYGGHQPELLVMAQLHAGQVLFDEPTDFEDDFNRQHIYFTPVERDGQTHYELKAVTEVYTVTAAYRIVDGKPQPMYQKAGGLMTWTQSLFMTVILAVLILVGQVLLGFLRSMGIVPQAKKPWQRQLEKQRKRAQKQSK